MATVTKHMRLPIPASDLWAIVGNVTRIDWVPVITACTLEGDVRTLEMVGAGTVQERIYRRDSDAMILEYGLINRPAVALHKANMQVLTVDEHHSELRWTTQIEPDALQLLIELGMQSALDALSQLTPAAPMQVLKPE
ncbi:SRPBCC family protein [Pseudohongiella spirulinae]|uniref:Polyketide cyclase n=1 Tax=Pseudohongiella spirulinae TaxID=1249552 RepID=A0A0S2KFX6_9GAMM|nr:SRPBCC family protein [Pseudohongiella spirulinae]ALO47145.1 hypothetical protein PS2015_2511 [Pseudohongiella spirulinae]